MMRTLLLYVLKQILPCLLPYPDPIKRYRVRRGARRLVGPRPLPRPDQQTGQDATRLALLRLLDLQKIARRLPRRSGLEALVLLSRPVIETCILGLYCLHKDDVIADLRAASVKSSRNVLNYLVADGILPQDFINQGLSSLGEERQAAKIFRMAELVESTPHGHGALDLYRRFYQPISEMVVHANATSLMRYVAVDGQLTDQPFVPWTRLSAMHLIDACVGMLAVALARHEGESFADFSRYATSHYLRVLTPLAVAAFKGICRLSGIGAILALPGRTKQLVGYVHSNQAMADTPEKRETRVRQLFDQATVPLSLDPDDVMRPVHEEVIADILRTIAARARGDSAASDTGR